MSEAPSRALPSNDNGRELCQTIVSAPANSADLRALACARPRETQVVVVVQSARAAKPARANPDADAPLPRADVESMTETSTEPSRVDVVASVLQQHAGRFRAFVAARLPSGDVDDVLQTAAMRAVERARSLNDVERVLPWLFRVHRNVVADTLRAEASRERILRDVDASPDPETVPDLCGCSVVQAQRLPASYADVLVLVDAGDATVADAAASLGITENNASVRLHRARKALRKAMREHCGVESPRDCLSCRCVVDGCCAA